MKFEDEERQALDWISFSAKRNEMLSASADSKSISHVWVYYPDFNFFFQGGREA